MKQNALVIVTGASTGIGDAAAHALAKEGLAVVACVRSPKDLDRLTGQENIIPLRLDVTQEDDHLNAVKSLREKLDKAEKVHLINNAGIAVSGPVEGVPLEKWRNQFDVNVLGLVRTTQTFLPWIRKTHGTIINIGSISGRVALPFMAPYAASKFAVEAISDSLRREMRKYGVQVVLIEPGPIETPIWEKGLTKKDSMLSDLRDGTAEVYEKSLGRFVEEVEKTVEDAVPVSYVTRVIIKALHSKKPKTRVLVGSPSVRFIGNVADLFPDRLLDRMVSR